MVFGFRNDTLPPRMTDTANLQAGGETGTGTGDAVHPLYVRITHWINALADARDDRLGLADL